MKRNQKKIAVNNQEDEDFEIYTLYPENAIERAQWKLNEKNKSTPKTSTRVKKSYTNITQPELVISDILAGLLLMRYLS